MVSRGSCAYRSIRTVSPTPNYRIPGAFSTRNCHRWRRLQCPSCAARCPERNVCEVMITWRLSIDRLTLRLERTRVRKGDSQRHMPSTWKREMILLVYSFWNVTEPPEYLQKKLWDQEPLNFGDSEPVNSVRGVCLTFSNFHILLPLTIPASISVASLVAPDFYSLVDCPGDVTQDRI